MQTQKSFYYEPKDYNPGGIHIHDRSYFLSTIAQWEADFHQQFPWCHADHLFANNDTMKLIHGSLDFSPDQVCGMELINGRVDMDAHMEMESYSSVQTIYALGSELPGNDGEPLFLIIDNSLSDGVVILKYLPEDDAGEIPEVPVSINARVIS